MHGIIGLGTRCFDGSKGASYHVCSERLLDVRLGRGGGMLISYHTNTHINKMNQVATLHVHPYDLQQVEHPVQLPGQCSLGHWQWNY